jgi:stage II sporulation protein D
VIDRRRFLALAASALAAGTPRAALGTGGLDPDLGTPPPIPGTANPAVRVLVASNVDPQRVASGVGASTFSYAGRIYRGGASIVDGPDRRPALVATVPIDAYLYGVVPLEIGRSWPQAALRAQAIVARTYALAHRVTGRDYDLVASAGDQVWGGIQAESPLTNAAVDATQGEVVTYLGGLASVFYSACCGGHTADASHLWGETNLPYLRGVPDPYCMSGSPYARWTARLTVGSLVAALGARAQALVPIEAIMLGDETPDGRPGLRIVGRGGTATWSSADVRRALGPNVLRGSMLKSLLVQGNPAQFATPISIGGSGSGHGVGLCQWGARVMAQQGHSARAIVAYYFPETLVTGA